MKPELNAPTPERRRRSPFLITSATATEDGPARAGVRVHRALSPLDRLLRTGAIDGRQFQAGEHFRATFELGVLGAREPPSGSASAAGWSYPEARLDALKSFHNARRSLGPLEPYVLAVVVDEFSISQIALFRRANRQQVAGFLKLGLDTLADHYLIDR